MPATYIWTVCQFSWVCLFILLVLACMRFYRKAVVPECVLLTFACYYILIRFSICRMILKSVASHSYAELRGNNLLEHESLTTLETRRTVSLQHACSDIFVSFRHRTFSESKPVTFTSPMSCRHACNVKSGQCVNFSWVSIYVSIYIISVNLHAFLLLSSNSRVCIIEFCVLLNFNQI